MLTILLLQPFGVFAQNFVCFEIKKVNNDNFVRMQLLSCACTHISQLIVVNSYPHIDTNEKVLDLSMIA